MKKLIRLYRKIKSIWTRFEKFMEPYGRAAGKAIRN